MSDQATPPEGADTAAVDTPQAGTDTQQQQTQQEVDWQKRYTDLQREFTTTRQQMTDPEYQQQVAQEWLSQQGYVLPTDEEPEVDEFVDPSEALRQELEELKQWRDQFESSSQQQQQIQALEDYSERKLTEMGIPPDPEPKTGPTVRDWLVSRAIALPPNEEGLLDVEAAYREFQALQNDQQKQWRETKRAPHMPANGQAGTETKNTDDMSLQELTKWARQEYANLSND